MIDSISLEANSHELELKEAIYNEKLIHPLLSERKLLERGYRVAEDKTKLYPPQTKTGDGRDFIPILWGDDGLFWIRFTYEHVNLMSSSVIPEFNHGDDALCVAEKFLTSFLVHKQFAHIPPCSDCPDCPTVKSKRKSAARILNELYRPTRPN